MNEPLFAVLGPFSRGGLKFILLTNAISPPRRQFIARHDSQRIVDYVERFTTAP